MDRTDWEIEFTNGDVISRRGDHIDVDGICDRISENQYGVKRFSINSDKKIIGTGKIYPDIVLHMKHYFEQVVDHFRYLDSIVVGDESESNLRRFSIPENVTIRTLSIAGSSLPLYYKVQNIYCSYIDKVPNIGNNIKVGVVNTDFMMPEVTQRFLNQFSEIGRLLIHSGKIPFLEETQFARIRIHTLDIVASRSVAIDVVLKNPHIITLVLTSADGQNFTADTSNIISIREIIFRRAALNSSCDVPPEIIRNQAEFDNRRFKSVKAIIQN